MLDEPPSHGPVSRNVHAPSPMVDKFSLCIPIHVLGTCLDARQLRLLQRHLPSVHPVNLDEALIIILPLPLEGGVRPLNDQEKQWIGESQDLVYRAVVYKDWLIASVEEGRLLPVTTYRVANPSEASSAATSRPSSSPVPRPPVYLPPKPAQPSTTYNLPPSQVVSQPVEAAAPPCNTSNRTQPTTKMSGKENLRSTYDYPKLDQIESHKHDSPPSSCILPMMRIDPDDAVTVKLEDKEDNGENLNLDEDEGSLSGSVWENDSESSNDTLTSMSDTFSETEVALTNSAKTMRKHTMIVRGKEVGDNWEGGPLSGGRRNKKFIAIPGCTWVDIKDPHKETVRRIITALERWVQTVNNEGRQDFLQALALRDGRGATVYIKLYRKYRELIEHEVPAMLKFARPTRRGPRS